jgi:hypothetical protein
LAQGERRCRDLCRWTSELLLCYSIVCLILWSQTHLNR